jgi:hypothetical protein
MMEWFAQQSAGQLTGLVAVITGPLIAIVAIVCGIWARVRRHELTAQRATAELAFKQQMVERGMSADEIERVLAAGRNAATKEPVT